MNKAPTVTLEPASQAIARTETAKITVTATDDGLPMNMRSKKPEGLTVRGGAEDAVRKRGRITFTPATTLLENGKSVTTARFSEPGEYLIQGVVDDGSLMAGTYCCWVSRE